MKTIIVLLLMVSTLAVGQISVAPKQVHNFSLQLMREINLLRFLSITGLRGELSIDTAAAQRLSDYQIALDAVVITGTLDKLVQLELLLRSYRRGETTLAQIAITLGLEDETGLAKLEKLAHLSDFIDTYTAADTREKFVAGDARVAVMQEISSNLNVDPAMVQKLAEVDNFHRDAASMALLYKVNEIKTLVEKASADGEASSLARSLGIEAERAAEIMAQHQLAHRFYMIAADQLSEVITADTIAKKYEELLASYSNLFDEQQLQQLKEFEQSVVETQVEDEETDTLRQELRAALVNLEFDDAKTLVERGADSTHVLVELASMFSNSKYEQLGLEAGEHSNMILFLIKEAVPLFLITELNANPTLAMTMAVFVQDMAAVEFLLQLDIEPQFDIDLQQIDVDAIIDSRVAEGMAVDTEAVAAIKAALQRGKEPEREIELNPTSQLFYAAMNNDSSAAADALEAGAELPIALQMSVQDILNEAAARFLVDLDQGTEDTLNELLVAMVQRGDRAAAKFLVELGANPTFVLIGAAHAGHRETALLLLEFGADANHALQLALIANDTYAADFLVELGANTEVQRTEQEHAADMQTVLGTRDNHTTAVKNSSDLPSASESVAAKLIAAVYRDATDEIARILQKEELPVDVVIDHIGTTLLHHAASEGKLKATTYLVKELGASLNITNSLNFTALDAAVFFRHEQVAAFLIKNDAVSAGTKDENGVEAAPTL